MYRKEETVPALGSPTMMENLVLPREPGSERGDMAKPPGTLSDSRWRGLSPSLSSRQCPRTGCFWEVPGGGEPDTGTASRCWEALRGYSGGRSSSQGHRGQAVPGHGFSLLSPQG